MTQVKHFYIPPQSKHIFKICMCRQAAKFVRQTGGRKCMPLLLLLLLLYYIYIPKQAIFF